MIATDVQIIENAILQEIEKVKKLPGINPEAVIDKDCVPGMIGMRSILLVTITGCLEEALAIEIPHNCYIFRDSDGLRELTIREAAEKLQKIAKICKTTI